jgi:CheY-like chemotaxis protein
VLVADDDEDIRALVELRLERAGYRVRTVETGDEALAAALAEPPDVAVVDVTMPGLDGYELTERLRARAATRDLPIVLLTAHAWPEAREAGLRAGATAFVTKPFRAQELHAEVERLLAARAA